MKRERNSEEITWVDEFENLYILSYQTLYRHAELIFNQEDKMKELLILTYMEAFQRGEQLQKEKSPIDWLMKREDFLAETRLEASKEMLEASYAEEKMQSKEAKKETRSRFDEASILLEIEDRLGIVDEQEPVEIKNVRKTAIQGVFSLILFAAAVFILAGGVWKLRQRMEDFRGGSQPEKNNTPSNAISWETISGKDKTAMPEISEAETVKAQITLSIGAQLVLLSENGQVLDTTPLNENEKSYENPEIQTSNGWTYCLPCPEREESQLKKVDPSLHHILYRVNSNKNTYEIVAQDVDDYVLWDGGIYVSQYGQIQRIEETAVFEKRECGIYAAAEGEDICLYDTLGGSVKTGKDGMLRYEDRLFKMSSDRIVNVESGERTRGETTYRLESDGNRKAIYKISGGVKTLFSDNGMTIDSFCLLGDWIYYSCCTRTEESGAVYSVVFRKAVAGREEPEQVGNEFQGRLAQMSASESTGEIYVTYLPESWKRNYGLLGVIAPDGSMFYMDDREERAQTKTTGNDTMQFVLVQNGTVYSYWIDTQWTPQTTAKALWKRVIMIPAQNRIPLS